LDGLWNFKTSPKVKNIALYSAEKVILFSQRLPIQRVQELGWARELQNLA
jgi:hypothetical protein